MNVKYDRLRNEISELQSMFPNEPTWERIKLRGPNGSRSIIAAINDLYNTPGHSPGNAITMYIFLKEVGRYNDFLSIYELGLTFSTLIDFLQRAHDIAIQRV